MSRSVLLPVLGLVGIVLYGTTRAGQPDPSEIVGMGRTPAVHGFAPSMSRPPPEAPPAPPPAPRLRSDVEAEERAAVLADTAAGAPADTTRAGLSESGLEASGAETP